MNVWAYLKVFVAWIWRCIRAWLEVGRRLSQIERDLQERADAWNIEIDHLEKAISATAEAEKSGFGQVNQRLEELDRQQREQLATLDRALQNRVDEWARQLSGQMNQLYAAVAHSRSEVRNG